MDEDHPEIELKYLPPYQRNQVKETIAVDSRTQAGEKVTELSQQANACRTKEQREAAEREAARHPGKGQAGTPAKPGSPSKPGSSSKPGSPSGSPSASSGSGGKAGNASGAGTAGTLAATVTPKPTPTTSQAPSEEQQKLERNCSTQQ